MPLQNGKENSVHSFKVRGVREVGVKVRGGTGPSSRDIQLMRADRCGGREL